MFAADVKDQRKLFSGCSSMHALEKILAWAQDRPVATLVATSLTLILVLLLWRVRSLSRQVVKLHHELEAVGSRTLNERIVKEVSRLSHGVKNLDDRLRDVEVRHVELIQWVEANVTAVDPRKTLPFPWGHRKSFVSRTTLLDAPSDSIDPERNIKTPTEGTKRRR